MDILKKYMVIISYILVPFGFLSLGLIYTGQHYAILLAMTLILSTFIKDTSVRLFLIFCVLWQVVILCYAMVYPIAKLASSAGFGVIIYSTVGATIYYAVQISEVKKSHYYNAICIAALIQSALAISQFFLFDPTIWLVKQFVPASHLLVNGTMVGTIGNPNFLAAFLAISLPFFFRKNWFYFIPLLAGILLMSKASSAVLPAIAGSAYFLYKLSGTRLVKYAIPATAITAILLYLFFDKGVLDSPRFEYWTHAYRQVTAWWVTTVFGMGPGASWGRPFPIHSEWVSCFHQFGIIGIGLFVSFIIKQFWKNSQDDILTSAFIVIVVNLMGNSALHYAPIAFLICIIVGLMEREVLWLNTKPSRKCIRKQ